MPRIVRCGVIQTRCEWSPEKFSLAQIKEKMIAKHERLIADAAKRKVQILVGGAFLAVGFILNFISESYVSVRHSSSVPYAYLGSWPNLFLPAAAFFLGVTGFMLCGLGIKKGAANHRKGLVLAVLISFFLTTLYTAFFLGIQFLTTGGDRLGECPGLIQSADASHEVPDSLAFPGNPAIGCSLERYGVLLSNYYDMSVEGVSDRAAQDRVLENLSSFHRNFHTHPTHVAFYERENWNLSGPNEAGARIGRRGPEKMLRVVTLR